MRATHFGKSGFWWGATAVLLLIAGCLENVVWLPDGSGIVYTEFGKRIVKLDLASKSRQVIAEGLTFDSNWPAISPDGKLVAVCNLDAPPGAPTKVEISFYSLDGKLEKKSAPLEWPRPKDADGKESDPVPPFLAWRGNSDKILAFSGEGAAVYDRSADSWKLVKGVNPILCGNTPVRPDGGGFLAIREQEGKRLAVFVDWQGKETAFTLKGEKQEITAGIIEVIWREAVASIRTPSEVIELDTASGAAKRTEMRLALLDAPGTLQLAHSFPGSDLVLCLFLEEVKEGQNTQRTELQKPSEKMRRVLIEKAGSTMTFFPSPDRNRVAVRCDLQGEQAQRLLVIDQNGQTLADLRIEDK